MPAIRQHHTPHMPASHSTYACNTAAPHCIYACNSTPSPSPLTPPSHTLYVHQYRSICDMAELQHTATHCNALQRTAIRCNTLHHTAAHCNTQQFFLITEACVTWRSRAETLGSPVCVRERDRERDCVCVCMCVCMRVRERE